MVKRKPFLSLRDHRLTILSAVIIIAAAVWVRAYPVILPVVIVAWAYVRTDMFVRLADWVECHTPFSRSLLSWGLATLFALSVTAYVLFFVVNLGVYSAPVSVDGHVEVIDNLCVVNRLKYGVARNADSPDDYYRTHRLGPISRGDKAIVDTPDGCLIQRIVARPGDTVRISSAALFVNSQLADGRKAVATFCRRPHVPYSVLRHMNQANEELGKSGSLLFTPFEVTFRDGHSICADTTAIRLPLLKAIDDWSVYTFAPLQPNQPDERCYPYNPAHPWNAYNWGPLRLPRKGDSIMLTYANVAMYGPMVKKYEGVELRPRPDGSYVFKMSYYMTLCDDRDVLCDSRAYGPIPESKIISNIVKL